MTYNRSNKIGVHIATAMDNNIQCVNIYTTVFESFDISSAAAGINVELVI